MIAYKELEVMILSLNSISLSLHVIKTHLILVFLQVFPMLFPQYDHRELVFEFLQDYCIHCGACVV